MLLEIPFINILPVIAPPALILFGFIYLWYRAESLHHIRLRLIRIFVSRRDLTNETINQHILDESSLLAFRFSSGIKAETLQDAEGVISFALAKNIPLSLISRAGRAFDISALTMREKQLPRRGQNIIVFLLALFFFVPAVILAGMSTEGDFMTSLKETGTKIWLSPDHVSQRNWFLKGVTIEKNVLCQPLAPRSGEPKPSNWLSPRDKEILCEVFNDAKLSKVINEEVKAQRRSLIYLAVLCGGMSVFTFILMIQGLTAQNLAQRLQKTNPAAQQAVIARPRKLCIHLSIFGQRRRSDH
ncbi:DUF6216 family protein [[Pseudomonas] hibiscicola]|uniref:DUF6216 family protein n=1 Tax=Stenotrophomonas hibiscicola TaxID=86189 RepID=A0ABV0C302_9GAMM